MARVTTVPLSVGSSAGDGSPTAEASVLTAVSMFNQLNLIAGSERRGVPCTGAASELFGRSPPGLSAAVALPAPTTRARTFHISPALQESNPAQPSPPGQGGEEDEEEEEEEAEEGEEGEEEEEEEEEGLPFAASRSCPAPGCGPGSPLRAGAGRSNEANPTVLK